MNYNLLHIRSWPFDL